MAWSAPYRRPLLLDVSNRSLDCIIGCGYEFWATLLTIIETPQSRSLKFTHSGWCPVSLGVTAMMRVAPRDRGAGLTQLKFGVWIAFVGICRPVPPVPGAGLWLEADVTL